MADEGRTVTTVKRVNEKTTVLWTKPNGRHLEEGALRSCPDVPKKEFLDQLATVEADIVAKTGFGEKFGKSFRLTEISVSTNASGRRQFTPKGKINFGWGETECPMSLLLAPDDGNKRTAGKNVLTENEVQNMDTLLDLARQYAEGQRHQGELALDGETKEAPEGGLDPFDPEGEAETETDRELALAP